MDDLCRQREAICREALTWLKTPYHHLACIRGVGVDCGRFIEGVAKALGLIDPSWKPAAYSPEHHWHRREEVYRNYFMVLGCPVVPWEERAPGVIMTFRVGHVVAHSGIYMPGNQLIHAVSGMGVHMHILPDNWGVRHDLCYDFPPRQEDA